jgi:hypothetical protein
MHTGVNQASVNLAKRVVQSAPGAAEKPARRGGGRSGEVDAALLFEAHKQRLGGVLVNEGWLAVSPVGDACHGRETVGSCWLASAMVFSGELSWKFIGEITAKFMVWILNLVSN